jgi:hypothetical protein
MAGVWDATEVTSLQTAAAEPIDAGTNWIASRGERD